MRRKAAGDGDEQSIEDQLLLMAPPKPNSATLIFRDPQVAKFVKYINHHYKVSKCSLFCVLSFVQGSFVDFAFFYQEEESKRGQRQEEEEGDFVDAAAVEEDEEDEEEDEEDDQ